MDKRYQVFISSTYTDLRDERDRVFRTLLELDTFPVGMELFPAMDEEQLKFIKRVIDDCDYYILIIGGRYGSVSPQGISYTELEYEYAIEKKIPVLAFIHGAPGQISADKSEDTAEAKVKLEAFRARVSKGRLVRFWTKAEELPGLVATSLPKTIKTYPAVGWVRANKVADNTQLLTELNEVRKRNQKLESKLAEAVRAASAPCVDNIAGLDDPVVLTGFDSSMAGFPPWRCTPTWGDVFGRIGPHILGSKTEESVKTTFEQSLPSWLEPAALSPVLHEHVFQTIKMQFMALGLMDVGPRPGIMGGGLFWTLTQKGKEVLLKTQTVKRSAPIADDRPKATESPDGGIGFDPFAVHEKPDSDDQW